MSKFSNGASKTNEANLKRSVAVVGRIAYPNLAEPDENGKYQCLVIIDPKDPSFAELKELVGDHAEALSGKRELPARYFDPIRSGDEPSKSGEGFAFKNDAFRGAKVIRAKSSFKPKCVQGVRQEPIDAADVKGGDHVVVEVSAYSYNNQSAGVALSLNAVWLLRPGETVIDRGGATGASFGKLDTSRLRFVDPKDIGSRSYEAGDER